MATYGTAVYGTATYGTSTSPPGPVPTGHQVHTGTTLSAGVRKLTLSVGTVRTPFAAGDVTSSLSSGLRRVTSFSMFSQFVPPRPAAEPVVAGFVVSRPVVIVVRVASRDRRALPTFRTTVAAVRAVTHVRTGVAAADTFAVGGTLAPPSTMVTYTTSTTYTATTTYTAKIVTYGASTAYNTSTLYS